MRVFHKNKDITNLITSLTWNGSRLRVARELEFSYVQDDRDPNVPVIVINNGETVFFCKDPSTTNIPNRENSDHAAKGVEDDTNTEKRPFAEEDILFRGNVFDVEKDRKNSSVKITAYDNLFILTKSKTTRKFTNILPEDITAAICKEMGIKPGNFAKTDTPVSFIADRKSGYEIIMTAYTEASKKTNEIYFPIMRNDKLDVILKGTLVENFIADASANMTNSTYKESIENLINQVMITDKEGNLLSYQRNDDEIQKYSMIQDVYKTDPNKDTQAEVKKIMKSPERSGYITMLGDYRAISSYSVQVRDSLWNGKFYIKSDRHTFKDGLYEMKLELEFENLMDKKETK